MKIACITLLAVGAFAVQDTTPPVISLNLQGMESYDGWTAEHTTHVNTAQWSNNTFKNKEDAIFGFKNEDHQINITNTKVNHNAGTECIRTSDADECPDPTCVVHDHHDQGLSCVLSKQLRVRAEPDTVENPQQPQEQPVNRNELGQFLLIYTAQDAAGNKADPVTFSFLFIDPFVPSFASFNQYEATSGFTRFDVPGYPQKTFLGNVHRNTESYTPLSESHKKSFGRVCSLARPAGEQTEKEKKNAADCRKADTACKYEHFGVTLSSAGNEYTCDGTKAVHDETKPHSFSLTSGDQQWWRYGGEDVYAGESYTPRDNNVMWNFDYGVTITDYNSDDKSEGQYYKADALEAYVQLNNGEAGGFTWHKASATNETHWINTKESGIQVVDYYVEDGAGPYGFKQSNNPNFHRVELYFYDHIAPKIYLGCYKNDKRDALFTAHKQHLQLGHPYHHVSSKGTATPHTTAECINEVAGKDLCPKNVHSDDDWKGCFYTTETDVTLECAQEGELDTYVEPGMWVLDNVDDWQMNSKTGHSSLFEPEIVKQSSGITSSTATGASTATENFSRATGNYQVVYTAKDKNGNAAATVTRKIETLDRIAPTIKLIGDHTVYNSAGSAKSSLLKDVEQYKDVTAANEDTDGKFDHIHYGSWHNESAVGTKGFECTDTCSKQDNLVVTTSLYQNAWCGNDFQGDPIQKDGAAAMVQINNTYTDGGAEIKNSWVFPEYTTGSYAIVYECKDESENKAYACRNVENVDHTRPIIQVLGSDDMTLEATHQGNYIDDGATCSDQVDGVISQNVEVSGDVVNLSKVGLYQIQYNCKDNANRPALPAWRKVKVEQTSCPTCKVEGCSAVTGCKQHHEASFAYTDEGATCSDVIDGTIIPKCVTCSGDAAACLRSAGSAARSEPTTCADNENLVTVGTPGTYYITYEAQNTVNKWNYETSCRGEHWEYVRTVVVQDTLKPVITLKYKNATGTSVVVAQGELNEVSVPNTVTAGENQKNKKSTAFENIKINGRGDWHQDTDNDPDTFERRRFMAEETSTGVNGWVLGAIASAVTGLALLGYSQRKTTVATSVPV